MTNFCRRSTTAPDVDVFLSDYWISNAPGLERSDHRALDVDRLLAAFADSAGEHTIYPSFAEAYTTSKVHTARPHKRDHHSPNVVRQDRRFAPELRLAEDYDLSEPLLRDRPGCPFDR